ncbi:hypothetical protein [Chitinimonas arctica]|uniref:hypothetical protein n=1 Tax=Chitinimonas arctica TaxID=2594795 RepID=UPI0015D42460|nr:hypothetical protein [Chitinimonas arctica]
MIRPFAPSQSPRLPLWFRIGGLLALVILFVVGLLAFLNYANFRKTVQGLHEARYLVLGKDLRQSVEAGLSLGLTPAQNARLPLLFNELKDSWPAIRYAGVIDTEARALLGTGPVDSSHQGSWRERIATGPADGIWHWRAEHESAVGLTLADNFGGKAGAVLIVYDDREVLLVAGRMAEQLFWRALAVILVAALLAWWGAWRLTRSLAAELDAAEAVLAGSSLPPDTRPLVRETQLFMDAAAQAEAKMAESAP